jgi:hypothetical protein
LTIGRLNRLEDSFGQSLLSGRLRGPSPHLVLRSVGRFMICSVVHLVICSVAPFIIGYAAYSTVCSVLESIIGYAAYSTVCSVGHSTMDSHSILKTTGKSIFHDSNADRIFVRELRQSRDILKKWI